MRGGGACHGGTCGAGGRDERKKGVVRLAKTETMGHSPE